MANNEELDLRPFGEEEEDELDLQPVEEFPGQELAPVVSPSRAALVGAGQGLTLGFAEELTAPIAAAVGMTQDLPAEPGENPLEKYQRLMSLYKETAREEQRAGEEQQPVATLAGAIGGGFLMPGAGTLSQLGRFKNLAQAKQALQATKAAGGTAKRLRQAQAAKQLGVGAGVGGAAGVGVSEGDTPEELAKDALTGSILGVGVGAAMPAVEKIARGAVGLTKEGLELIGGPTGKALMRGMKGQQLIGQQGPKITGKEISRYGKEIGPKMQTATSNIDTARREIIGEAMQAGKTANVTDDLVEMAQSIADMPARDIVGKTEKQRLTNILKDFIQDEGMTDVSPQAWNELRQTYRNLSKMGDASLKDPTALSLATKLASQTRNLLEEMVPGTAELGKKRQAMTEAAEMLGLDDVYDMNPQKVMSRIVQLIHQQEGAGASGVKGRQIIEDALDKIKLADPELARKIAPKIDELADRAYMTKKAQERASITYPLSTLESYAVKGSNVVGLGLHKLAKAPPRVLRDMASDLTDMGGDGARQLGMVLERASNQGERSRQAILFGIMQNPTYRNLLKQVNAGIFEGEGELEPEATGRPIYSGK